MLLLLFRFLWRLVLFSRMTEDRRCLSKHIDRNINQVREKPFLPALSFKHFNQSLYLQKKKKLKIVILVTRFTPIVS